MKFYIKSIRDTATGTVFINQPETCPAELEPYRLKHLPGMAECVQVYPSQFAASQAYADELLYASYANMPTPERHAALRQLMNDFIEAGVQVAFVARVLNVGYFSLRAYCTKSHSQVPPRVVARLRIFHDAFFDLTKQASKRLPDEGDCGRVTMSRGGNPTIFRHSPGYKKRHAAKTN